MKRFIAGAVCPKCRALDRVVLETRSGQAGEEQWQRCVSCGHEAQKPSNTTPAGVPRGKPERRGLLPEKTASQTVKIMDLHTKLDPQDEPK